MKALQIESSFGLENLRFTELADPTPGPGQVLLRMRAASLNYRDLLMAKGAYNPRQPLPLVPCSDGVGVVEALGPGVERVQPGQRVATLFAQGWLAGRPELASMRATLGGPLGGTLAEFMVLDAEGVSPVPEHLSDTAAATLPCAALTAWSALAVEGSVKAGDTVLLEGTGGVSIFALQLAQMLGARTIITSSSDAKLERARELGAWKTLNYRQQPDWGKAARQLTDGQGVDHVVEVGGAGTLSEALKAIKPGGTLSLIGVLSGVEGRLNLLPVVMQNVRLQGILVGSRAGFEDMVRAIDQHQMEPVVDRVFPFAEAAQAFRYLDSAQHFGKVCIEF